MSGDHQDCPSSAAAATAHGTAPGGAGIAHPATLVCPRGLRGGLGLTVALALTLTACAGASAPASSQPPSESASHTAPGETLRSTPDTGPVPEPPCVLGVPVDLDLGVNTPGFDGGPTPSFDGLRLYFVSDRPGGQGGGDVWVSTRPSVDAPFGAPENLGPNVNGAGNEGAPSLSRDELSIVFDRDDGGIWTATRSALDAPFGDAERLDGPVNTPFAGFPALSSDGLTLYFASERSGGQGDLDLWQATKGQAAEPYGDVQNLGPSVNLSSADAMATVSADDLSIVFASTREGGMGDWDLWMAVRPDAQARFDTPLNLGRDVNTEGFEGRPHLTSDGSVLFFMSDRPGGQGAIDLWQVTIDCGSD